jgi:hypothetical protein
MRVLSTTLNFPLILDGQFASEDHNFYAKVLSAQELELVLDLSSNKILMRTFERVTTTSVR